VGREEAIAELNALVDRGTKVIAIQARGGVGKTTLARKYLQQKFGSFLEISIAQETKDIASIESLIEEKLRQLGEEPGREFWVSMSLNRQIAFREMKSDLCLGN
jgi:ABC-type dipeptide/oligopeptide/nickel transport system ATPase subunit